MGRHGENIRKRKDGRWEARFIEFYDVNGKAKYRYIYGKSYQEVKEKRKRMIENTDKKWMNKNEPSIFFRQVINEWLLQQKDMIKESTYANYANLVEKHILPVLGDHSVSELDDVKINHFLKQKLLTGRLDGMGGLSAKTVSDIRSILILILTYAKKKQYIVQAIKPDPISVKSSRITVLSKTEQKRLEKIVFNLPEPIHLGIIIALYAGLRIGEVCALRWGDFDFMEETVHINKTLIRIRDFSMNSDKKTKVLIQTPKSACSIRTIPLPRFLSAYLKKQQKGVFVYLLTGTEDYLEPRACLKKYKQVLQQAELKSYTFHTLRHTFATRCVENGFDIKSLSEIMGHSSVSITMQRYVHPSMDMKRQQMNRLTKI